MEISPAMDDRSRFSSRPAAEHHRLPSSSASTRRSSEGDSLQRRDKTHERRPTVPDSTNRVPDMSRLSISGRDPSHRRSRSSRRETTATSNVKDDINTQRRSRSSYKPRRQSVLTEGSKFSKQHQFVDPAYPYDSNGFCLLHPSVRMAKLKTKGWKIYLEECPQCLELHHQPINSKGGRNNSTRSSGSKHEQSAGDTESLTSTPTVDSVDRGVPSDTPNAQQRKLAAPLMSAGDTQTTQRRGSSFHSEQVPRRTGNSFHAEQQNPLPSQQQQQQQQQRRLENSFHGKPAKVGNSFHAEQKNPLPSQQQQQQQRRLENSFHGKPAKVGSFHSEVPQQPRKGNSFHGRNVHDPEHYTEQFDRKNEKDERHQSGIERNGRDVSRGRMPRSSREASRPRSDYENDYERHDQHRGQERTPTNARSLSRGRAPRSLSRSSRKDGSSSKRHSAKPKKPRTVCINGVPFDKNGCCNMHPHIKLASKKLLGGWKIHHEFCKVCVSEAENDDGQSSVGTGASGYSDNTDGTGHTGVSQRSTRSRRSACRSVVSASRSVKSTGSAKSMASWTSNQSKKRVQEGHDISFLPLDADGFCLHHPDVQLAKMSKQGGWKVLLDFCPGESNRLLLLPLLSVIALILLQTRTSCVTIRMC